ncbi:hypothetical protein BTVI_118605 [Pitangus sulphuratus]|nr:hypothetical protein BTVI_118605 [Pitangus sulphuratus]
MEDPPLEQEDVPCRKLQFVESPCWSRILEGPVVHGEKPTLEQVFPSLKVQCDEEDTVKTKCYELIATLSPYPSALFGGEGQLIEIPKLQTAIPANCVSSCFREGSAVDLLCDHPMIVLGIALTQLQHLALGPVELHEVCIGPPLKPVKVSLDGIPSLEYVNCTTQLGVISKLAEGEQNPTVHVNYKDAKH